LTKVKTYATIVWLVTLSQKDFQMSDSQIISISDTASLIKVLANAKINYEAWRKTPDDLFEEISTGETTLKCINGQLERHVSSVFLEVISPDGVHRIVEDRQVFNDGRKVKRGLKEIAEKHKPGEKPLTVAKRALKEELFSGMTYSEDTLLFTPREAPEEASSIPTSAYEGLTTVNNITRFSVQIPKELYKHDGYIEVQLKKTNYYVWEVIFEKRLCTCGSGDPYVNCQANDPCCG
jgi:hypothetical protein